MSTKQTKKELVCRINFLLQAGMLLQSSGLLPLSTFYLREANTCAEKSLVKIDMSIKRMICKGCSTYLMAGSTARTRIKKLRGTYFVITCTRCSRVKRIKRKFEPPPKKD